MAAVAPVTFAFCSGPMVWRAARVAARFVTAAAFVSTMTCACLGALKPKSARVAVSLLPNFRSTKVLSALSVASVDVRIDFSVADASIQIGRAHV